MVNRQNKTIRPDQPVTDPRITIEEVYHKYAGTKLQELRVWVEVAEELGPNQEPLWGNAPGPGGSPSRSDNILLFLKYFDVEHQTLRGAGHLYIGKERKVEELVQPILKRMGWPEKSPNGEKTQLKLYEVSSKSCKLPQHMLMVTGNQTANG